MLKWNDVLAYARNGNPAPERKVKKTDDEWRRQLGAEAFAVTRKSATERPFSSEMCSLFKPGTYECVCCGTPCSTPAGKFESGTGWPSFTQPLAVNAVAYRVDGGHGNDADRGRSATPATRISATCFRMDRRPAGCATA